MRASRMTNEELAMNAQGHRRDAGEVLPEDSHQLAAGCIGSSNALYRETQIMIAEVYEELLDWRLAAK